MRKIEPRTYSYGGAVVYFGIAVVCGGSVVQQVASTIDGWKMKCSARPYKLDKQYSSIDSRIQNKRHTRIKRGRYLKARMANGKSGFII